MHEVKGMDKKKVNVSKNNRNWAVLNITCSVIKIIIMMADACSVINQINT